MQGRVLPLTTTFLMENAISAEMDRRYNHPEQREGAVEMARFYFDDLKNTYIAEWSDGICQFYNLSTP